MNPWSLIKLADSGMKAVGIGTGALGSVLAGPLGVAVTATMYLKQWVDSQQSEVFEAVKKRESCPHIEMVEGSPPTPSALALVADRGGVAWRLGSGSLYFWHAETPFRPSVFSDALLPGVRGVTRVTTQREFALKVVRPADGYGCSACRRAVAQKQQ
ncbi:hypothetical protein [Aquincola sp. J276]|uniref:hypothetical protein n=1 Tax=Aquincola sp. J276 TaxID=2898432 RepID=UPI002151C49A|nr:hypothetical protein [Aquincola sp. J276]MCR5869138.1 hypothetical protein [Aquincola sp. J276]